MPCYLVLSFAISLFVAMSLNDLLSPYMSLLSDYVIRCLTASFCYLTTSFISVYPLCCVMCFVLSFLPQSHEHRSNGMQVAWCSLLSQSSSSQYTLSVLPHCILCYLVTASTTHHILSISICLVLSNYITYYLMYHWLSRCILFYLNVCLCYLVRPLLTHYMFVISLYLLLSQHILLSHWIICYFIVVFVFLWHLLLSPSMLRSVVLSGVVSVYPLLPL